MCLHEVGFILHDYGGAKRVLFFSPDSRASLLYSCGGIGNGCGLILGGTLV